ncbi:hypothetical protein [Streptomyces sp. NBC_01615]|uniref:hypothetical protein n=1 Tax=Streptomyces sp. NBC_01615 TaxID=2975898 RepID=UPI00386D5C15
MGEDCVGLADTVRTAGGPPDRARHDPRLVRHVPRHALGYELRERLAPGQSEPP